MVYVQLGIVLYLEKAYTNKRKNDLRQQGRWVVSAYRTQMS